MKMKKMIGAFALTAALAMGTAPAFATVADDGSGNAFSDSGSTEVKAKVDTVNKQVRATVPLQITVVFGATGASDITGPSSASYCIKNIGEGDIQVAEAEVTEMHSTFSNEPIYLDGNDWLDANGDPITNKNAIMFTYTTALNETYLTDGHPLSQAKSTVADKQFVENAKRFQAETIAVGDSLPITLGGKCFFTDTLTAGEQTDTLCKIKYTIQAVA